MEPDKAQTEDMIPEETEPRDTEDLPLCLFKHNQDTHQAISAALNRGAEFYAPDGHRLFTMDDMAEAYRQFRKILGAKPRQPDPSGKEPLLTELSSDGQ